ncbi:MAG: class I SAM-dependent methyltransferase [Planctomycetota bacterium]
MTKTATKTKRKPNKAGKPGKRPVSPRFSADTADRHDLYQLSVQNVESEVDFVCEAFEEARGRLLRVLREDFAGTANTACEFVSRDAANRAVAVDLDGPTLGWGREHNLARLSDEQKDRVSLVEGDVRTPGPTGTGVDAVLAMNFSYWIFQTRDALRDYFAKVRESLADDGVFFLDFYGGYEAMSEQEEDREIDDPETGKRAFTYVWDQHRYNPITGEMDCRIHFKFRDGTRMQSAFEYTWRLWTLPEIRELLAEAGYPSVAVYCEGTDEDGEGDGVFEPAETCDADAAFICYIVAAK